MYGTVASGGAPSNRVTPFTPRALGSSTSASAALPMPPADLLEAGLLVYLSGLGLGGEG